jgi:hypothetical protein
MKARGWTMVDSQGSWWRIDHLRAGVIYHGPLGTVIGLQWTHGVSGFKILGLGVSVRVTPVLKRGEGRIHGISRVV